MGDNWPLSAPRGSQGLASGACTLDGLWVGLIHSIPLHAIIFSFPPLGRRFFCTARLVARRTPSTWATSAGPEHGPGVPWASRPASVPVPCPWPACGTTEPAPLCGRTAPMQGRHERRGYGAAMRPPTAAARPPPPAKSAPGRLGHFPPGASPPAKGEGGGCRGARGTAEGVRGPLHGGLTAQISGVRWRRRSPAILILIL